MSQRSDDRLKQMKLVNVSKSSSRTQFEHERGKICVIYTLVKPSIDSFLVHFMMTYAFSREFMRIGVNPMAQKIEWAGCLFTVSLFRKILTTTNNALPGRPSLYQALWGRPGDELATSMHNHNWLLSDDAAHKQLERLVQKWLEWGVDVGVQIQLISLASVYNGKAVSAALDACTCIADLPIQAHQLLPEMWDAMTFFFDKILASGSNPFSIRFRGYAYNACLNPPSVQAKQMVHKCQREVLLHVEALSLCFYKSYAGKLSMLSRTKGYSDNVETSFLGKNLVNTLSALGEKFGHLQAHVLSNKDDHPNGPGATAFFDFRSTDLDEMAFRRQMEVQMRRLWPTDILVIVVVPWRCL